MEWFLKPNTQVEFGIMKVGNYVIEHYTKALFSSQKLLDLVIVAFFLFGN